MGTLVHHQLVIKITKLEHSCWYPKDGELCLNRVKPGETLVEARNDSDVQIDREIWV